MKQAEARGRRMPLPLGWALAVIAIAVFCALGVWQLSRQQQKQAALEAVAQVLHARQAQPLSMAAEPGRINGYDWAAGAGRFAQAPAVLLDNQQRAGQAGVRAYRVFVPQQGERLLVDLGWLPLPDRTRLPAVPLPLAEHVAGLLTPPPSSGIAADYSQRIGDALLVTRLQPQAIAAQLAMSSLAPRILRLDPALPFGYPRDLDVLPNTLPPERHLGYAVQWFGLAAAVLVTALVLTFRTRRATSP